MLRGWRAGRRAVFVTVVPSWSVGETFLLGDGEHFRIFAIKTEISDELSESGVNAVFIVEPV
jgi:hypothetical protein